MKKKLMLLSVAAMFTLGAFGFSFYNEPTSSCPLEGTKDCPKVNCQLKGTPDCPYEKTLAEIPSCCVKK